MASLPTRAARSISSAHAGSGGVTSPADQLGELSSMGRIASRPSEGSRKMARVIPGRGVRSSTAASGRAPEDRHADGLHVAPGLGGPRLEIGEARDDGLGVAARAGTSRRRNRRRAAGYGRSRRRGAPAGAASARASDTTRSGRSSRTRRGTAPPPWSRSPSSPGPARGGSGSASCSRSRGSPSRPGSSPPPMPNRKRPPESRSRLATSLAVVMVSRSMTRQMPGADLELRGHGRGGHERHEGVERVLVLLGQLAAAREGRLAALRECGCAPGTHRDSKPRSSAARASSSMRIA